MESTSKSEVTDYLLYSFRSNFKLNQREIEPEGMLDNQIIIDVLKQHGLTEEQIRDRLKDATLNLSKYVFCSKKY